MRKLITLLIVLGILSARANAQDLKLPYIDQGACPFECCQYAQWIANKTSKLRDEPNASAIFTQTVAKGDKVQALGGHVATIRAGQVKILHPIDSIIFTQLADKTTQRIEKHLDAGMLLDSLHYEGEGSCAYWVDGRKVSLGVYCLMQGIFPIPENYTVLSEPQTEWWIKIRTKAGNIGWSNRAEDFENKDACG